MTTHTDLIHASQAIGAIPESAYWNTQRLAERVERAGCINVVTVAQMAGMDRDLRAEMARAYGAALV